MLFKHIYDEDLAQGSYLIGCQQTGEAVVVDPRRDVGVYLDEADANNMLIVAVTETHIHADFLSGSRELSQATGAKLYVSGEGDADWTYSFGDAKLRHGDTLTVGNVTLEAVHTPGHTPEHLSFLVTDGAQAGEPGFILTGDFVFVGDVGRPDLLDEAALGTDTRFEGAKQLFRSLKTKFMPLPDYVQVWPGHGAGSACGKSLGAVASTTVGYERAFSWWAPFVQNDDEGGFVDALLGGQPDAPKYFNRMKRQNKAGPALLGERDALEHLEPADLTSRMGDDLLLIDTRAADIFKEDAVKGAINIPAGESFATYASYVIDPEEDTRNIILLAADEAQASHLRDKLSYVGMDKVTAYVTSVEGLEREEVESVSPDELAAMKNAFVLDVRTASEFASGHIPDARQIHAGRVMWNVGDLPRERPLVTHCQSGARNAVVASALREAGFDNVVELEGSFAAWKAAGKSVSQGSEKSEKI